MSQTTSQMPDNLFEDEISLTDIIVRLWKRRGLIVLLPLLCCGATLIWLFTSVTQSRTPTVHFIDLTGIEKSAYPSGAPFSVQDLVAPEVLAHLADRVGLENNSDFREAISVSAYSPSTPGILKKYDQNLSRSNLSTTEIDAINAALTEELARTTERTVRISIDGRALACHRYKPKSWPFSCRKAGCRSSPPNIGCWIIPSWRARPYCQLTSLTSPLAPLRPAGM